MTKKPLAGRISERWHKFPMAVTGGLASLSLVSCATTAAESLAAPSLPAPLVACANEVVAAWREARATTEAGCNWAAVVTIEDARKVQSAALSAHFGNKPLTGYKMTFTSDGSTVGEYREGMLVASGQSISKAAAWQTLVEADLLFRVKDSAINEVRTLDEALTHIDAVLPFVEVSNPIVRAGGGRTKVNWTSTNASVGSGAMGSPFPIDFSRPETMRKFLAMKVTLVDAAGVTVRQEGVAADFLPGLLDLRDEVLARGQRLKVGDLLSLGTFGRPLVGEVPVGSYTVIYHNLADSTLSATAVIAL